MGGASRCGGAAGTGHYVRAWAIPLVVVAGGILAGWLVFTWAPEAEGHGTDAAIDAVHYNPRGIRLRAVVVKIIASALTIGSGGSGGREGPTAQISAGFGSLLARVLDLSPEDGRIAVSIGIGSGIGAIFSAPLGGAVLAADVVYKEDFEYAALVPGVFASIIAYAIFGAVYGYRPLFATPQYHFNDPMQLFWFAIIGLLAGGVGLLYSKTFYGVVRLSHRLPFSRKLRPAAGGILVGFMALALPEVLGTGYGWVQKALSNDLLHTSVWIFLLLPLARIAATALSIGTGGSGGVFGPGMVIGAFTGLAVWRVFEPVAGSVGHNPAPYIVVGMMAVFGGISRAPLAVMLMVGEMTGNIEILAPAMVAIALATFIVARADDSIYRSQLRRRYGIVLLGPLGYENAYVLAMRRRQAAEDGVIFDTDMAGERCCIGHHHLIANTTVVRHMAVSHEEVVMTNPRYSTTFHGATIDGHKLTYRIVRADFERSRFTCVAKVLRSSADRCKLKDMVMGSQAAGTLNHCMRTNLTVIADFHLCTNDRKRPDYAIIADPCQGIDDGLRMNLCDHWACSRSVAISSAEATSAPLTSATVSICHIPERRRLTFAMSSS